MKRRRLVVAAAAAAVALAVTALPTARLRFLALPLVHDPSVHDASAARLAIAEDEARATETTRVPGRISAILPREGGTLFIATFDSGLYRFDPRHDRAPVEVGALDGRERFVDALAAYEGHVIVGTHRGALVLSPDGARLGVIAAGEAVSSLDVTGGDLLVGTAHGLWRARDDAPLGERGPEGETLRVTALAAARDRVWIGTPDGVYAITLPLSAQVASWHPLVFGSPGASSNVVTALALVSDGVVAGTDDGGVVYVDDKTIDARPFGEVRANDINPGALIHAGSEVFIGTEGAGLVALDETRTHARRIGNTFAARISAVAVGDQLWFGSEEGAVYSMTLPTPRSRVFADATTRLAGVASASTPTR